MKLKINNLTLSILFIIFGAITIIGCSKKSDLSNDHSLYILRQDVGSEPPTLDPALAEDTSSNRIMYDLFAGLLDFDQENNPISGLAESWESSADGKTYTFHLRKGLKFSDGSPIDSSDFVYSWRRLVDPKTASPYNFLLSSVVNAKQIIASQAKSSILGVYAPDQYTFVVKLEHPDPYFLREILLMNAGVVPRKIIEKYGTKWTDPKNIITSGAYKLKEHVVNGYVLAEKNPYYYDANNISIKQVKYLPFENNNITISSYKSGGLDITFQSVPVDQYADLQRHYKDQLHTVLQEAIYYYDFNMKDPIFSNNLKLRKALSMAVDRNVLVKKVLKQNQQALYSLVTPTVNNGAYKDVKYDWAEWPRTKQVEVARKLFTETLYNTKNPLKLTISYNTNDTHKRVALAIAAMWKQVFGSAIQVNLQNQDWKTFIQARHKGSYQLARDGWVADYNGVTSYTNLYECGGGANNSHYCNKKYNILLDQAMNELDRDKRIGLIKQALSLAMNDYATIPLFQYSYQQLIKPYVKGYNPDNNYLEHMQTKWMKIEK
ncbi:MAG: peptide ABC transporter substrate-binding protein [Neisseriaceae bacterium]